MRVLYLALVLALGGLLVGCAAGSGSVRPSPTPTPVHLPLGVLPLGGVVAVAPDVAGPYRLGGPLAREAKSVRAARALAGAEPALQWLAQRLGVPGPPISLGGGLAYNLGSTSGFQLTAGAGLADFNLHPNKPVEETGATPSVKQAEAFAESFLQSRGVPGAGAGLIPLPQLSSSNGSDRRVFFQWSQAGYPVVDIEGVAQEIYADVAANYRDQLSLVGISGAVPVPLAGRLETYPALSPEQAINALRSGAIDPGAYFLQADDQPFPSPSDQSTVAVLSGGDLGIVDSAGYAVPVLLFQVQGRAPVSQLVVCAAPTYACAPLRYQAATPSPSA